MKRYYCRYYLKPYGAEYGLVYKKTPYSFEYYSRHEKRWIACPFGFGTSFKKCKISEEDAFAELL